MMERGRLGFFFFFFFLLLFFCCRSDICSLCALERKHSQSSREAPPSCNHLWNKPTAILKTNQCRGTEERPEEDGRDESLEIKVHLMEIVFSNM